VPTTTDAIRHACALVAARARFVRINEGAIDAYARSLPLDRAAAPAVDWSAHYRGTDDADVAAFFLTLDTINFGSGYFPRLAKRPGMSGYYTVATSLKDAFDRHGPIPAARLAALDADDCRHIFGQSPDNPDAMELMARFATALNDLGRLLLTRYAGQAAHLIESAHHSAEALIPLLAAMPFFRDVSAYDGLAVPLYKRAQIVAADLALALNHRGLGRFDDLARLTIFADNLVPHVLRVDGVLAYDAALLARIDREELLVQGSPEEFEISATAVHAVELMRGSLLRAGRDVTLMTLDNLLWHRGGQPHYKARPRHRARCVYY
jgi:hypothetical protein